MKTFSKQGLNQAQAAKYVGLSRPTFRRIMHEIPHRTVGTRLLFSVAVLDKWLEGSETSEVTR